MTISLNVFQCYMILFLSSTAIYLYITAEGTAIMHELKSNHRDQMNVKKSQMGILCCLLLL